jgi:glucosamine--fructose-6-phosphate aminotransferase (isomerizing)
VEGDCAEVSREAVRIIEKVRGSRVDRPLHPTQLSAESVELGSYQHYMQKEIFEQPRAIADTLELAVNAKQINPGPLRHRSRDHPRRTEQVLIVACGTSSHAGLVGRYWIESIAGIRCNVEIASEYRYRSSVPNPRQLVVAISQSGETADTLAALEHAKSLGQPYTLGICNVAESAHRSRRRAALPHARGPRDRGRIHQGVHHAARLAAAAGHALAKARGKLPRRARPSCSRRCARCPTCLRARSQTEGRSRSGRCNFALRKHALFLGRGSTTDRDGRRVEAEGDHVHPRRGVSRGRAQARAARAGGPLMPVIAIAPRGALLEK